jgi:hypothetical protein
MVTGISCITIGNEPAFDPAKLSSAIAFYDARKGVSSVGGTGTAVTQWNDQTVNGYHLTTYSVGTGPVYSSSGGPNGHAYMTNSNGTGLRNTGVSALSQPIEIFFVGVASSGSNSAGAYTVDFGVTGNSNVTLQALGTSTIEQYNAGFGSTDTIPIGSGMVIDSIFNGLSSSLQVNSGTIVSSGLATTGTGGGVSIGNYYPSLITGWVGPIYSVLICNTILSADDRRKVMVYFQTVWNA